MAYLDPLPEKNWSAGTARHLLNRAGFGVPLSAVPQLERLGMKKSVDSFINIDQYEDNIVVPDWLPEVLDYKMLREQMQDLSDQEKRKIRNEERRKEREALNELKIWWLKQMIITTRPLQEKMTLFWHGHFATSALKVRQAQFNYDINARFRRQALGNFKWLTIDVSKSPAMLRYLDNQQNNKKKPNENFARELMELFTMGIGNYTEKDIKESARAFTGWTQRQGKFFFNRRQHDEGYKTFMGRRGKYDGDDIIDIIFEQPVTAEFISKKLWEFFVYENPGDDVVEECAVVLRKANYRIDDLLRAIFESQEFYSPRAMGTQIKSPTQYMIGVIDGLDFEPKNWQLVNLALKQMGQDLFVPPNVKGWPGNRDWINTNTLLIRYNIPGYVIWGTNLNLRRPLELDELREQWNESMAGGQPGQLSMNKNTKKQRQSAIARAPFKAMPFFKVYGRATMGETVDSVSYYFLGRSLDSEQRTTLIKTLSPDGKESSPFNPEKIGEARLRTTVHLMMSMSEYQLC